MSRGSEGKGIVVGTSEESRLVRQEVGRILSSAYLRTPERISDPWDGRPPRPATI